MNRVDAFRSSPLIDAIGWALLHSLWEGAAVALALAFVLGLLHRATAQARYLVACSAMVLLISLPVCGFLRSEGIFSTTTKSLAPDRALPHLEPSPIHAGVDESVHRRPWQAILDALEPFVRALVAIWTAGNALLSLRLLGGWVQARRWVRLDTRSLADCLIDRVRDRVGVRCRVALLESSRVAVPLVVGWLRPAILVPVAALSGLTALEMEAILAHELAHIRRHDYLVNLVQCLIETLMFHHPATWWISGVIRREREHCCDDIAVLACRDRVVYARALAAMEGLRVPVFSLSPAASGGNLLARIRRILNPMEESMKPVQILVAMFAVTALVPIWLVRAGEQVKADPGSPRLALVVGEPFPDRSFAHLVTSIDARLTGSFTVGADQDPAHETRPGTTSVTPQPAGKNDSTAASAPAPAGTSLGILRNDAGVPEDPPSDAEVWSKVIPRSQDHAPFFKVERNNVRIVIEKIGDKTDPVKVYPLAGACQLVHRHYECTVYFDQVVRGDYPIPFNHVDHKVEVVYISKDFLRRAAAPEPAGVQQFDVNITYPIDLTHKRRVRTDLSPATSRDDRINGIVGEIEQLKQELQSDRQDQERVLDGLIRDLQSLKKQVVNAQSKPR